MTAGGTALMVHAPDRPTLAAVRAVVVDHTAFEHDEMVMADDLVVGADTAAAQDGDPVLNATALVVALALDEAGLDIGELVEPGVVDDRSRQWVQVLLERGRAVDDIAVARERLALACWMCGCSEDRACDEGCGWAAAHLCTACVVSGAGVSNVEP